MSGALILLSAGCITFEGESSGTMKRRLQSSYVYRSAQMFYPQGDAGTLGELPALEPRQFRAIEADLQQRHAAVVALHELLYKDLQKVFPNVQQRVRTKLRFDRGPRLIAETDEQGVITVNVKVAQALYRAAVTDTLTAAPHAELASFGGFVPSKPADPVPFGPVSREAERKAVAKLMATVQKIDEIEGRTMIGDLFGGLDSPWFEMADLSMESPKLEMAYAGTAMFLLAHERGHAVLRHHDHLRQWLNGRSEDMLDDVARNEYQQVRRALEHEADFYATLLLSTFYTHSGLSLMGAGDLRGYDTFFRYSYEFSGFTQSGADYPTVEERLAACREHGDAVVAKFHEQISAALDQQMAKLAEAFEAAMQPASAPR